MDWKSRRCESLYVFVCVSVLLLVGYLLFLSSDGGLVACRFNLRNEQVSGRYRVYGVLYFQWHGLLGFCTWF